MFYDYLFSFYLGCKNIAPLNYTAHNIIPDISKIGASFCLGIQLPVCLQRALYVVVYSSYVRVSKFISSQTVQRFILEGKLLMQIFVNIMQQIKRFVY